MQTMAHSGERSAVARAAGPVAFPTGRPAWRSGLPTLAGQLLKLRELRTADAPALLAAVSSPEVTRFMSPPPATLDGVRSFIRWARRERATGRFLCFGIVPAGSDAVAGLFQLRSLEPGFGTAEWGFALAEEHWGRGVFVEGAELFIDFAMTVVGTFRLEARSVLQNGRGNGALRKLGAVHEGVLRRSFLRNGRYLDQALWAILADDWFQAKTIWH